MFLRKLSDAHFTIKECMSLYTEGSPEWQLEQDKMRLLKTLIHFIKTDAIKQAPAKAKLDALMTTHFDYARVANMFHTSVSSIKASISYLSKSIESKVGVDTLDLLLAGDLETAHANFLECSRLYSLDDLIVGDIKTLIPHRVPKVINLIECEAELKFLKVVSKEHFSTLDLNRLILIRYILEGKDTRYQQERQLLASYLKGVIALEELCDGVREDVW